jgi:hypothetical protein
MKFLNIISTVAMIASIAATALADQPVKGHPKPLPEEMLVEPIHLNCGATIYEWRGSYGRDIGKLNALCDMTHQKFMEFVRMKGLKIKTFKRFTFPISLLSEGEHYRDLNDLRYRFNVRATNGQGKVWGWTSKTEMWSFMLGETSSIEFDITFVHELFHCMSMHYGIFEQHPAGRRPEYDERLAREFTTWLGMGE